MPGGLLNLASEGQGNIILNGNPQKTFFTSSYKTYTNFGLQKFRIDFNGQKTLRMNERSVFKFTVPRYAELLMDTYIVIDLPTIWSPIYPPKDYGATWRPYEFKWIENLGSQMIDELEIVVGGQTLQRVSGQYLYNQVEREWSGTKKELYYNMTGNVKELNDPANAYGRNGQYPNAYYTPNIVGAEPSIRGRQIYIPLNVWFTNSSKQAFPLASLQYNQLEIIVSIKPVADLFVVRDLDANNGTYIRPNFNDARYLFYKFLQPPPSVELNAEDYSDRRTNWNANIHLNATYAFLSEDEVRRFSALPQSYLIKEVHEKIFYNTTGSGKVDIDSLSLVSNWTWFFQRSDVNLRNQWSNYTNWAYKDVVPSPMRLAVSNDPTYGISHTITFTMTTTTLGIINGSIYINGQEYDAGDATIKDTNYILQPPFYDINNPENVLETKSGIKIGDNLGTEILIDMTKPIYIYDDNDNPGTLMVKAYNMDTDLYDATFASDAAVQFILGEEVNPSKNPFIDASTEIKITGDFSADNHRDILDTWSIVVDGKYRENEMPSGVYNYVEKYLRTSGGAPPGVYFYNFGLTSDPFDTQPSGSMNMSSFNSVQFEFKTFNPPLDPSAQFVTVCDPTTGEPAAINKPTWRLFDYTYNLHVMEERYNVVRFSSGNVGLMNMR